jgi:hypothetical protein
MITSQPPNHSVKALCQRSWTKCNINHVYEKARHWSWRTMLRLFGWQTVKSQRWHQISSISILESGESVYPPRILCHNQTLFKMKSFIRDRFHHKGPADRVSAAKIFPHSAFSRADISPTCLNPRCRLSNHPVCQYLVLFLACVAWDCDVTSTVDKCRRPQK